MGLGGFNSLTEMLMYQLEDPSVCDLSELDRNQLSFYQRQRIRSQRIRQFFENMTPPSETLSPEDEEHIQYEFLMTDEAQPPPDPNTDYPNYVMELDPCPLDKVVEDTPFHLEDVAEETEPSEAELNASGSFWGSDHFYSKSTEDVKLESDSSSSSTGGETDLSMDLDDDLMTTESSETMPSSLLSSSDDDDDDNEVFQLPSNELDRKPESTLFFVKDEEEEENEEPEDHINMKADEFQITIRKSAPLTYSPNTLGKCRSAQRRPSIIRQSNGQRERLMQQ